jgi:hypothetical protein
VSEERFLAWVDRVQALSVTLSNEGATYVDIASAFGGVAAVALADSGATLEAKLAFIRNFSAEVLKDTEVLS